MADYGVRRRRQTFIEVVLPTPTNAVEIAKALNAAHSEWGSHFGVDAQRYDDSISVRIEGEAIVFFFEVSAT